MKNGNEKKLMLGIVQVNETNSTCKLSIAKSPNNNNIG